MLGEDGYTSFTECKTCFRLKPSKEFSMETRDPLRRRLVKLCLSCRTILWDNPDNASEGSYYYGTG